MGGRSSNYARRGGCSTPRERAFLLVSWDAAFLKKSKKSYDANANCHRPNLEEGQGQSSTTSHLIMSQVFAVAPPHLRRSSDPEDPLPCPPHDHLHVPPTHTKPPESSNASRHTDPPLLTTRPPHLPIRWRSATHCHIIAVALFYSAPLLRDSHLTISPHPHHTHSTQPFHFHGTTATELPLLRFSPFLLGEIHTSP